ncbi:MAG: DinB superfamily protein [Flavipsychrobacter sp.]|nr:DinB superfamily protein [Flavipsychrobacter sp.]
MQVYAALTDRLKTQHLAIENILLTTTANRVVIKPEPDKWSIHDNIAHLAKYQPVFSDRISRILLEDEPFFDRYVAELDPEFENYRALDTDILLKQLNEDRKKIYDLITTLDDARLNRTGIHKKYGSLTIVQWTEFFLLHEAHHIFTIFRLAYDSDLPE